MDGSVGGGTARAGSTDRGGEGDARPVGRDRAGDVVFADPGNGRNDITGDNTGDSKTADIQNREIGTPDPQAEAPPTEAPPAEAPPADAPAPDASRAKIVVRVPRSLHASAIEAARREGVSLNTFVVAAVARAAGQADTLDMLSLYTDQALGEGRGRHGLFYDGTTQDPDLIAAHKVVRRVYMRMGVRPPARPRPIVDGRRR